MEDGPVMLPGKRVALVQVAPPPWMRNGLFSVMLPLIVCEPVLLLRTPSPVMKELPSCTPLLVRDPLLTIMSRAKVELAGAPEMLRSGGAPTRSTSFVGTPRVIAP